MGAPLTMMGVRYATTLISQLFYLQGRIVIGRLLSHSTTHIDISIKKKLNKCKTCRLLILSRIIKQTCVLWSICLFGYWNRLHIFSVVNIYIRFNGFSLFKIIMYASSIHMNKTLRSDWLIKMHQRLLKVYHLFGFFIIFILIIQSEYS